VGSPVLSGVLAYVGSVAYVAVVEGRDKRRIKSAFAKYVSPDVVNEIAEDPAALRLGGPASRRCRKGWLPKTWSLSSTSTSTT
jgi:hypothetical protein